MNPLRFLDAFCCIQEPIHQTEIELVVNENSEEDEGDKCSNGQEQIPDNESSEGSKH